MNLDFQVPYEQLIWTFKKYSVIFISVHLKFITIIMIFKKKAKLNPSYLGIDYKRVISAYS